jgi:hypothetical protein
MIYYYKLEACVLELVVGYTKMKSVVLDKNFVPILTEKSTKENNETW